MMYMLAIFLIIDALLILSFAFTPYVTRKTELFGVSLPASETNRPELSGMRRAYRNISLLIGAIMIVAHVILSMIYKMEAKQIIADFIIIVGMLIVYFLLYLAFHNKMKAFKKTQDWSNAGSGGDVPVLIVDTEPASKESFSAVWLILYPIIAVATGLWLKAIWSSLPSKLPMHMDIAGKVDRWADKDFRTIIELLWPQWLILIIFAGVYFAVRVSKRQIDAENPEESREQGRKFRRVMSASMLFGGALMGIFIGVVEIFTIQAGSSHAAFLIPLVFFAILIILILLLYLRIGQGGSRMKTKGGASLSRVASNPDDDKYWKLGQFYFNSKDPAVWVEARFGIGFSLNFARPLAWILIVVLIAIIVVPIIILI
jgi:uncharacterized membrane protein